MYILSFDPGGTTGWASYNSKVAEGVSHFDWGKLEGADHHLALWNLLNETRPDRVICEKFNYQRRQLDKGVSLELISRNYIGVIELWHQMFHTRPLLMHELGYKTFWLKDDKIKKLGMWPTSQHERDALSHLLYYITFTLKDERWLRRMHPDK